MTIEFFVPGIPSTAGSKRTIPIFAGKGAGRQWKCNVVTDDSGEKGKNWRESVKASAVQAMGGLDPFKDIPLLLEITFVMPRPNYHFRSNGELKANAPKWHTKKPDTTKMVRAVEDAMTAIVWKDDAIIPMQIVRKIYGAKPGASVRVSELNEATELASHPGVCQDEAPTTHSRT